MTGLLESLQAHVADLEKRLYALEHAAKALPEVVVDPAQQDIMGDGDAVAKAIPTGLPLLERNFHAPEEFSKAAAHVAFRKLKPVVDGKMTADKWPAWARLINKYGWRCIIKATEEALPNKRWPSDVEQLIKERPTEYANV
jgi:hypothetical protein